MNARSVSVPFGNIYGFGNNRSIRRVGRKVVIIESYYSQGMRKSMFGIMPSYAIVKSKSSDDIASLGTIKNFARFGAYLIGQDDAGNLFEEQTSGSLDFSSPIRQPQGTGQGMIVDQKGRLIYSNGTSNNYLGVYDGSTWNDTWKTITSWVHPMDTFEDLVVFGNNTAVGLIFSDDTMNDTALTLPSGVSVAALRSGKKGCLIGANLGYQGILILWDCNATRAIAPWTYVKGKVLAIDQYNGDWIVLTQKQLIYTNGYTAQVLFDFLDDPFGFGLWNTIPQGMCVVNDKVLILQQPQTNRQSSEFGRMKPGLYIFDIPSKTWEFCPISTGNTYSANPGAVAIVSSYTRSIPIGYRDTFLGKNYLGSLSLSGPSTAQYVSEKIGTGPTDKQVEAIVLNFGLSTEKTDIQPITFTVSVKVYNFDRQLWGSSSTNAIGSTTTVRVDGTSTINYRAQAGDEVTFLEGANAGAVRHIASIANKGLVNETWTLDVALASATENSVHMNVMPFRFVSKKTLTAANNLTNLYFNGSTPIKGKKFLVKLVIENMNGVQPEMHDPVFIYKDLGLTPGNSYAG